MMKQILGLCLLSLSLTSCGFTSVTKKELIGKWDNSYQISTKDSTGKWSDWYTINTFQALPQLEFTSDGKILWDGEPASTCCLYISYELRKDKIVLKNPTDSEVCNCANCPEWKIENLTSKVLEINQCFTKTRYLRAQ
jgi:hypothetical protein